MDDILSEVQADETLVADEQQSEVDSPAAELDDEAETVLDGEGDPDADGSDDQEQDKEKPKKRSGIERLKRQLADVRAELELERSRRAPALADSVNIEAALESEIGAPPNEENFSSWYEYERALTAYETEKRMVAREIRKQSQQMQAHENARIQAIVDEFVEREHDVAAAIPDYHQVTNAATTPVSNTVARMILESDKGALLKYHFSKNASELQAINNLDPISAARAIGRLEQRLSLPAANRATKAQKPVVPVKGGAGLASDESKLQAYLDRTYGKKRT